MYNLEYKFNYIYMMQYNKNIKTFIVIKDYTKGSMNDTFIHDVTLQLILNTPVTAEIFKKY